MQRRLISLATASTIGLAGLSAGVVVAPALASAATGETTLAAAAGDRLSVIKDALTGLVRDGTITQAQADRVATTLDRELPRHGPGHRGFHRLHLADAAEALGLSDLRAQLVAGKSLAEVAEAEDVPVETLISKLVAAGEESTRRWRMGT